VYWNPAGLATGSIVSFLATFSEEKTASNDAQAATGERLTGRMVALSLPPVGIAFYRLGAFGTERVRSAVTGPQSREEVRRSVQALTTSTAGVSLLQSLTEYIVVGVTPKVVHGADSTTFDVDAGLMIAVERIRLGLVARNLTTPAFARATAGRPGESVEIELSREVRMGAAWGSGLPGYSRVMVSVDGDLTSRATPNGDRRDVAAGVETWWRDRRLGLRGGVRRSMIGASRAAVAAGVSAGLTPGTLLEAHVVRGQSNERGWSLGIRMGF
jgi:F plasmid transfer operon protein TraF